MVLGAILVAMWIAAVNYENNLSYLVLSSLISISLVSLVHTQRNLSELRITAHHVQPVFAGESIRILLSIENRRAHPSYALVLDQPDIPNASPIRTASVNPRDSQIVEWIIPSPRRGHYRIEKIRVSTQFPLGLFRAWCWLPVDVEYMVYPKPEGNRPWTEGGTDDPLAETGARRSGDDFYGLRSYVEGDSIRHIHWKAAARGGPLVVKEFGGGCSSRLWFDWDALDGMEEEAKISQLTLWVVQAGRQGRAWGFRMPGTALEPSHGVLHERACLRALALYPQ